MASNFPGTAVDSFAAKVDGVDYPSAEHQNSIQDAMVAVQTKVGITSSADVNSLDYKVANMWKTVYPIGCIYQSVVLTSPAILFGGTWSVCGAGRVLVGIDAGDPDFDTVGEAGGAKTATLTTTHLPAHTHTGTTAGGSAHTHLQNSHIHSLYAQMGTDGQNRTSANGSGNYSGTGASHSSVDAATATNQNESAHTHTFTSESAGSGAAFSIMNPSEVVYRWKRTA